MNCTGRLQDFPGAKPVVQVFPVLITLKSAEPVPEIPADTVRFVILPTLETVTLSTLVVPCVMVPKASDVGDTDASAEVDPESGMAGLDPPLVVRVSVPVLLPTALGLYWMGRTQLAPGATDVVHVLPVDEREKPVLVIEGVSVKAAVPTLVMVRLEVAVVP